MKYRIIIYMLIVSISTLFSQRKKHIGVEFFGSYGLTGLSYDSRINEKSNLGYKVGLSYGYEYNDGVNHWYLTPVKAYYPEDGKLNSVISIPINIHYLFGKERNFLETGLGICTFYTDYNFGANKGIGYYSFGRIAYRHESSTNRLLFSLGIDIPFKTPASGLGYSLSIAPSISIGYKL
jgi:hypothetical protein